MAAGCGPLLSGGKASRHSGSCQPRVYKARISPDNYNNKPPSHIPPYLRINSKYRHLQFYSRAARLFRPSCQISAKPPALRELPPARPSYPLLFGHFPQKTPWLGTAIRRRRPTRAKARLWTVKNLKSRRRAKMRIPQLMARRKTRSSKVRLLTICRCHSIFFD